MKTHLYHAKSGLVVVVVKFEETNLKFQKVPKSSRSAFIHNSRCMTIQYTQAQTTLHL